MKTGDRVCVIRKGSSDYGNTGIIKSASAHDDENAYAGAWVLIDGRERQVFFYFTSLELVKDEMKAQIEHLMTLTPKQQEVYHAAVALSEAQSRFQKALENLHG